MNGRPRREEEDSELSFFVSGEPVPKARARIGLLRGGKVRSFTPKRTAQWEEQVRWNCRVAATSAGWKPLTERAEVVLIVHRKCRRGDADNYAKSVLDGMNGIAFTDDSVIRSLWVRVKDVSQDPGVWIAIRSWNGAA